MALLSRHIRLLFALALFQVVGGPLVLCGVVFFSRSVAEQPALSISTRIGQTIDQVQRLEYHQSQGMAVLLSDLDATLPGKFGTEPGSPPPLKGKDGKAKLHAIPHAFGIRLYAFHPLRLGNHPWQEPALVSRACSPPLPPPRLA